MPLGESEHVLAQCRDDLARKEGEPILGSLATMDVYGAFGSIDILDSWYHALSDLHSGAVDELGHQSIGPMHPGQ
jgi:hypothetical protein